MWFKIKINKELERWKLDIEVGILFIIFFYIKFNIIVEIWVYVLLNVVIVDCNSF